MSTCTIDGCGRRLRARGLCGAHYEARRRQGGHSFAEEWADLPGERWAPVANFEEYEVSTLGRARTKTRTISRSGQDVRIRGRVLRLTPYNEYGHLKFSVNRAGCKRDVTIHSAVLEAFVGPRPEGMEACHNNGNPADNRVENLRWDTHAGNMADVHLHAGFHKSRVTHCPFGHEYTAENTRYTTDGRRECRTCSRVWRRRKYLVEKIKWGTATESDLAEIEQIDTTRKGKQAA